MDETLFETDDGQKPATPVEPESKPAPQGQPDNSAVEGRLTTLENAISETNQAVMSLTRTLSASVEQAAEAERKAGQPETVSGDDFRAQFVEDPAGMIDRRAQAVVERLAGEQLTPTLTTIIETTHDTLMAKHEALIEKDFGPKAWKEVVEPAVKQDVERLREHNVRALADPVAVKALVDRQVGMNWRDLSAKQTEHATEQRKAMEESISKGLPGGGAPRVRVNADVPSDDIKTFWGDVERSTGEKVDQKLFMKLHNTGNTIDDYLKAVGTQKGQS